MKNMGQIYAICGLTIFLAMPLASSAVESKQTVEIMEQDAVRRAEEFIIINGYTDQPGSTDESKLSFELFDDYRNIDQTLASRRDKLERKAYGIHTGRKGSKSGWAVIFQYRNGNPDNGRAVTMDPDGSNIRIEHVDFSLDKVEKKFR